MLPDWTTAKFVQEVEKFLNCIILIDPLTKGCQIIPIPDYYSNNPVTYIPDDAILDDFDIAFDADEDHFFISYENLSYNLPYSYRDQNRNNTTHPSLELRLYSSTLVNTSQHLSTDTGKTPHLLWGGPEMGLKTGYHDWWDRWKHRPLLQDN